ncbi:MAG TPA: CmcI family methyltransferase [Thermoanaerobaculia bacterium]|nr:CmcI family methyltransferase [Thermoanaerobaculia bacterium]
MSDTKTSSDIPYELLMKIQQGTMAYRYRGIPLLKNPFDLALYPMLLERARPRTLLEIGSYAGGSAIWFADQAKLLELRMDVVSIDLEVPAGIEHSGVRFLQGDARALGTILTKEFMETLVRPILVIEDSNHLASTTAAVLEHFDPWMLRGEYIVIEDGVLTDMRVAHLYEGGPTHAVAEFLDRNPGRYEIDRSLCDYFGRNVTWNVDGYLRRV